MNYPLSAVLVARATLTERERPMSIDQSTIPGFIRDFPGEVLRPGDAGFAEARAAGGSDGSITRQPSLIARPTTTEAVAMVIALCRETRTDVTVRGGGHSAAGSCVEDGAVMIDLSRMNDVRVDPDARRASVGAGASWAAVDAAPPPRTALRPSAGRSATPAWPGSRSPVASAG